MPFGLLLPSRWAPRYVQVSQVSCFCWSACITPRQTQCKPCLMADFDGRIIFSIPSSGLNTSNYDVGSFYCSTSGQLLFTSDPCRISMFFSRHWQYRRRLSSTSTHRQDGAACALRHRTTFFVARFSDVRRSSNSSTCHINIGCIDTWARLKGESSPHPDPNSPTNPYPANQKDSRKIYTTDVHRTLTTINHKHPEDRKGK